MFSGSVLSDSFVAEWSIAHQAALSRGFPRQEYWSRLHFLFQGIFLTRGSNLCLLHWQTDSLSLSCQGSPRIQLCRIVLEAYLVSTKQFRTYYS